MFLPAVDVIDQARRGLALPQERDLIPLDDWVAVFFGFFEQRMRFMV